MDGAETYDWDPGARGTDLRGDSTNVAPDRQPDEVFAARPLQRSLVISNYTFDAVITLPSSAGIRYLPVRGLWDTGSDVYLISRNVLQRANIGDEDLEHVADKTTLHGIGGAVLAPEWKVQLTWHVKRNMNSRQDTFYVADDISCDMLVPWTLNIGSRYTGMGTPGQNALILQLRRKSNGESQGALVTTTHVAESQNSRERSGAKKRRSGIFCCGSCRPEENGREATSETPRDTRAPTKRESYSCTVDLSFHMCEHKTFYLKASTRSIAEYRFKSYYGYPFFMLALCRFGVDFGRSRYPEWQTFSIRAPKAPVFLCSPNIQHSECEDEHEPVPTAHKYKTLIIT